MDQLGAENGENALKSAARFGKMILLVESRILIRECLTYSLQHSGLPDEIVSASSLAEWSAMADSHSVPEVVLLSVSGRKNAQSEIDRQRAAFAQSVDVPPVIVLADEEDPTQILEILDSGARGFIPTSLSLKVAIEAIRLVIAGGTYVPVDSFLASHAISRPPDGEEKPPGAFFTERQFAVIEMLRQGKANKTIAHELNMRESTVKVHIRNIMRKLSASNRTQVAYLYQSMISTVRVGSERIS